ncbi:hypothetical protein [Bacillus benzoevorans]
MATRRPVEYSGKVLDQRNTLTGPGSTPGEQPFPQLPDHISIGKQQRKKG